MPYVPSRCLFFLTVLIQNRSNSFPPINIFIINILTYVQEDVFSKFPVAWLLHFSFVMTLLSASVFLKNRGGKENIFSKLEIYWLTALPKQKVLLKNFNLFCFFHNKNMFYWIPLWSKRTSGSALLRRQESPPPHPPHQRRAGRAPSLTISQPLKTQLLPCSAAAARSKASAGGHVFNQSNLTYHHHHHHHQEDRIIISAIRTIIIAIS